MSSINLTVADADGDKSVIGIDFSGGFAGNIDGLIENTWGVINPLVNGTLVSASVTIEADITDLVNAAAAAISDVQEGAKFVFKSAGGFLKTITLPTFIETFFTGSGANKEVDITNSSVAAFVTAMETGFDDGNTPTPVGVDPTTSHFEDLTALVKTHEAWGKTRR